MAVANMLGAALGAGADAELAAEDRRAHLERRAMIYLRQSSPRQVRENFRSTELQYGLAEEAVKLGWQPDQILTIDGDLGVSPVRDSAAREGVQGARRRACAWARSARSSAWRSRGWRARAPRPQRLLEYCGLTDTLVIDADGIYDLQRLQRPARLGGQGSARAGGAAHHGRAPAGRQAPRGRARRAALPAAGRPTSTTTRATRSSTPTRRSRPRSPTCSRR